ncbi:MAG: pilus assembly protein PilP [Oryzomonas sp.]|uniref:pilus assembly protein PilP n=1 Tax=Oryzomonas sp. TaxID=2855186 RepID=UPI00283DFC69|nr:pilus assembly protein PilP [Oryzomonas sp.]MDR3579681.1 pilus assembly protein PilP [Oryzomonas sp.]
MIRRNQFPNRWLLQLVVAGVVVATLLCCKKHEEPAPAHPAPAQPPKAAIPQQSKPVQKQVSSALALPKAPVNQFDFSNKKDPFRPFVIVKASQAPADNLLKRGRNALPIHSFDVNQFKMIGFVTGDNQNKAMVVDPNGKGYVLKVGMTIGKNEGLITSITSSGVSVVEQFRDDNGRVRKETIKITLPRKQ